MLDGGTALAWTALDAATDRAMRDYLQARASKRLAAGPTNSGPRSQESG